MDLKLFHKDTVDTILGEKTTLKGSLITEVPIRIDGTFEGEIISQSDIFLSETSRIKATINGKRVIVSGEVMGDIHVTEGLEICKNGRVYGNIGGTTLIIHEGALFKGQVNMDTIASQNDYEGPFELRPTLEQ